MPKLYMAWRALDGISGHDMGRQLLSELYAQHAGSPMPEIHIAPMGKPFFENSPWYFSITHTNRHAFCLLADCPVGIDAEELDRKVPHHIIKKILSPREMAQVDQAQDPNRAFLCIWVLKEATAKHSGEGIRIHPCLTDFTLPDDRVQEIAGCLVAVVY